MDRARWKMNLNKKKIVAFLFALFFIPNYAFNNWENPKWRINKGKARFFKKAPFLRILTLTAFFGFINLGAAFAQDDLQIRSIWDRFNIFIVLTLIFCFVSWYLYHIRRGKEMYIRPISGLSALDEAVGRATEMGKSVLYIPGIADIDDIQTLAGLSILGYVAKKTAEYDTPLMVPCSKSVVMSTAQEIVKESYMQVGRPDAYVKENIHYLTDDQFGYAAGVDGIMLRERPAANFFMGLFFAESLILAETGYSTGAIQIAGTAAAAQLPFFVVACDYTLIGEELYAASAYLSRDPQQIGSLKGQDSSKVLIVALIVLGCLCATFAKTFPFLEKFVNLFTIK